MENFGARDERPKAECLRLIQEESDSFIGVYAHRYGYIPKGERKSITEAEYDAASRYGISRFIYLVDEDALWKPGHIDNGEVGEKLRRFKERVRAELITKSFGNKDQLATYVAADLGRHIARAQLLEVSSAQPQSENTKGRITPKTTEEWNEYRYGIYQKNRDLFFVHILAPSRKARQKFDIFVFLKRHRGADLSDVKYAEFFFGPHWDNQVFRVENTGGYIGLQMSAYGEFLCVCRVTMLDGSKITLERYIDFGGF
jgi:hypothetical protein